MITNRTVTNLIIEDHELSPMIREINEAIGTISSRENAEKFPLLFRMRQLLRTELNCEGQPRG